MVELWLGWGFDNYHPPQIPFDSVLLYICAGTRIYNYELVTALSPWHFSETYANSLSSIILYYGYPATIDNDKLTLHHAARPR